MRISRVQIDNYRNLKHVDVVFESIVAIIGENNSGKSNFLRALSLPLSSDDIGVSKHLSWYDINMEAKDRYYEFLRANRASIIAGSLSMEQFESSIPTVSIQLYIKPDDKEHYNVNDMEVIGRARPANDE